MVFQSYALYPSMTVRQNITFGMECRNVPRPQREEAVSRVVKLLQIEALLDRKPAQLSGGQRQRVAMGRALVRNPLLFLFDEPLSNLDAQLRAEMRMEIKQLHQRLGSTMVYVTHDQIEAMTLATRIAVMHQGVVQQFADPETVYNRPANLFVARFMGAPPMNTLSARLEASTTGTVAVIGQGDAEIRLPVPAEAQGWVGREVVLGIRPECITEPTRRFGDTPGTVPTISAPVDMIEPTGAETIVVLRLGNERALGRVSADLRPRLNETARFAIDTRKINLFDPSTGDRIAP
jgi:multiple sugar transport system ATP-binding protein